jgi:fucose permease
MNTRLPLWPLCLATTAAGMAMISLGPLLDAILRDLGAARALGGVLSLAFFGGMCLAIAAVNFILGAFSSRATLMLGATLQGLGMVLAGGLAGRLGALAWSLAVIGFGYGLLTIYPGMIVTSLIKPAAERPLSIINGFFAVGVLATPLAIGQALAFGISWRGVFLGEGIISFGLLPLLLKAPLPDMPGRQNIRFRQIAEIWRHNPRLLILILLALWLYVGAENIFNVWLAKFQIDTFASSASRAGLTVSLFWLGLTIGRFGMVRLLARVPPHRIVFAAACFMAGGVAVVALAPWRLVSEAACLATGLAASVIFPLVAGYAGRFPRWYAGVVFSLGYLAASGGSMLFPYLVGPAADWCGFRLAMLLAAAPSIAVALLAVPLRRSADA